MAPISLAGANLHSRITAGSGDGARMALRPQRYSTGKSYNVSETRYKGKKEHIRRGREEKAKK